MIHITRKAFEGAYHLVRNLDGYISIGKCANEQVGYVRQEKKSIDSNITGLNKAVFYIFPDTETLANHL